MINQLTGSIPSLSALTNLVNFYCNTNQLTGPIPSLSASTNLVNFHCYTNQLTGPIPSLSTLINLQEFRCNSNQFTGFNGGSVSNTLGYFDARVNQLTSAAVNAILAAFVAANKTTGTKVLLLGGTGNGAPTGQGITDKATLISRGWTVTTN
jgi:Leucine-rich repeat (LRR) protein